MNIFVGAFFNKIAGLRPVSLLKEKLQHRCFRANFVIKGEEKEHVPNIGNMQTSFH